MEQQLALVDHHIAHLVLELQQQGVLDDQFSQLMGLQDESNPDFVAEVVQLYYEDSAAKIDRMCSMLVVDPPNYAELDALVHQFKGSSASLGAAAIAQLCIRLREGCQVHDRQSCIELANALRSAYVLLKSKLDLFLGLESQKKQISGQLGLQ